MSSKFTPAEFRALARHLDVLGGALHAYRDHVAALEEAARQAEALEDMRATAARLRDELHAEGNRFGMMRTDAKQKLTFTLGEKAVQLDATADKWKIAQHMAFDAAGRISHSFGIEEYGVAWNDRLHPQDLRDRDKAKA